MTYPTTPGFSKKSKTSREAASRLTCRSEIHLMIMKQIQLAGARGMIVDEAHELVMRELDRPFDRATIAARFTELTMAGLIVRTEETRPTPKNRSASVYVLSEAGAERILLK